MAHMLAIPVLRNPGCPVISFPRLNTPTLSLQTLLRRSILDGQQDLLTTLPFLTSNVTPWVWSPKNHFTEWRTIYHLSYLEGDSINDYIPKDPYSLQYVRVDDAISIIKSLGQGSFMAKTVLKSAFRLIPGNWNLLGIYQQNQYYVDLYLPFGLRSAPYLFNQLSDALEWILKTIITQGTSFIFQTIFFIAEAYACRWQCLSSFSTLLRLFMSDRAPVVASKTLGPSQVLEFMGIELDSTSMEARLPEDKLLRTRALLNSFTGRRSVRLFEL